jgi:hypothetical protein
MSLAPMITLAETSSTGGINHWVIGAGLFVVFLVLMAALLMFGAGRDHS